MIPLVLASSSPYRQALLAKLCVPFVTASPEVDETRRNDEPPRDLAKRLAQAKAHALRERFPAHLIIGSDQVADLDGRPIGKPGTVAAAKAQLQASSGQRVSFHTGLCLLDTRTGESHAEVDTFNVHFRALLDEQIDRYLTRESPLDCAGSFKAEGLGIALFERLEGDDPNSLVGLPLIRLVTLLNAAGLPVP